MTDDERENYEERAAIMEHDGGLSRELAERRAWDRVMRPRLKPSEIARQMGLEFDG